MSSKIVISITIVSGDIIDHTATLELSSEPMPVDTPPNILGNRLNDLIGSARWLMRGGTLHPHDPWGKEESE